MLGLPGEVLLTKSSRLEVMEKEGRLIVRKNGLARGIGDLRAQIRALQILPESLLCHYPRLLSFDSDQPPVWYEMPFYSYPSLRDLVFGSDTPADVVESAIDRLLRFLFDSLYPWRTGPGDAGYVDRAYVRRMQKRIQEVRDSDPGMSAALSAREVLIDGKVYESAEAQLERIRQRCGGSLAPPWISSTHGQLEFDHVLVGEHDAFIVLDTSGVDDLADAAYDLGKIRQSLCAKVDLVKQDQFDLRYEVRNNRLMIERFSIRNPRLAVADQLSAYTIGKLRDAGISSGDLDLEMRSEFAEAVHLASSLPYYYAPSEAGRARAIALYVQSVLTFADFSDRFLSC